MSKTEWIIQVKYAWKDSLVEQVDDRLFKVCQLSRCGKRIKLTDRSPPNDVKLLGGVYPTKNYIVTEIIRIVKKNYLVNKCVKGVLNKNILL